MNQSVNTTERQAFSGAERLRVGLAVIGLPVLLGGVVLAVGLAWRDQLPDPIGIHWGTRGVDGFSSFTTDLWVSIGMTVISGLLLGIILVAAAMRTPYLRKGAGAMAGGLSAFVAVTSIGGWWIQRGLTDARDAPDVGGVIVVALIVGLAFGLLGAWVMPGQTPGGAVAREAIPTDAPRVALSQGQRAAWLGWARSTTLVYVAAATVVLAVGFLFLIPRDAWTVLVVVGLVALLLLGFSAFRVSVGAKGLVTRSIIGWPRFTVPLSEVAEASVVDVSPMRDFGGWGLRGNFKGQFGVVLRSGEALEVRRGDGSKFVVTVDRPEEAAALLNTLADADRTRSGPAARG